MGLNSHCNLNIVILIKVLDVPFPFLLLIGIISYKKVLDVGFQILP